jgi:hypothetical protein
LKPAKQKVATQTIIATRMGRLIDTPSQEVLT